jgi:hypothetical protein
VIGSADGFRPSIDFRGGNEDQLLPNFASRYFLHGRVFQLDNEFHDVAQRPFVWGKRDVVTPLEGMRAWVSLCALTGYSYLLGGAMEETSDERWAILSRALPPSGSSARPLDLAERPLPQIWSLRLSGERPRRQIIALFNWDYEVGQKIEVKLTRCGLDPTKSYAAFDFWGQKFLGEVKESLGATLLPRNAQIVWLTEITEGPQLIGGSRHLAGPLGSTLTSWDPAQRTLRGSAYGHGDPRVSLFLYVPQRWAVSSAQGAVFEQVEPRVIRLDVPTTKDPSNWAVTFDPLAKVR